MVKSNKSTDGVKGGIDMVENIKSESEEKEATITFKKSSLWKVGTFVFFGLFIISLFTGGFGGIIGGSPTGRVIDDSGGGDDPVVGNVQVSIDDDPMLGNKNAPVTLIEFSDYQCPFCRKYWTETFPLIKKEYVDTGKVKVVFRDFPLGFHPMAIPSATAANCVREKGGDVAYWKMHDKIFSEENILDGGTVKSTISYTEGDLKKWAKDIGYDIGACLDSKEFLSEIQKDQADGQSYGVSGTPAFFVNGNLVSGAQPFSEFKRLIDSEL